MTEIKLKLPYKAKGIQINYYDMNTRYAICRIGRQWGKSMIAMLRCIKRSIKDGIYWWVEPTIPQSKVHMRRMARHFKAFIKEPIRDNYNKTERFIKLKTGGTWFFKGADDPENLEGETLSGLVLDEAAKYQENVWYQTLRPMLSVNLGWADFIGKPRGKNYFKTLWDNAENDDEWSRMHEPSNSSPFFSDEEFEKIRQTTPERFFRQEYLAEFLDSDSEVFRGILDCVKGNLEEPKGGRIYVMGVDLAKVYDWTVITVWDLERKHLVGYERFNKIDWPFQEKRIANISHKYNNARIILDATGVGDPIYDNLTRLNLWVDPIKFTNVVKVHLIENLAMMIEKRDLTYPHIPELIAELQIFSIDQTPAGRVTYNAPSGYHDDIVISMGLAALKMNTMGITAERHGLL